MDDFKKLDEIRLDVIVDYFVQEGVLDRVEAIIYEKAKHSSKRGLLEEICDDFKIGYDNHEKGSYFAIINRIKETI